MSGGGRKIRGEDITPRICSVGSHESQIMLKIEEAEGKRDRGDVGAR